MFEHIVFRSIKQISNIADLFRSIKLSAIKYHFTSYGKFIPVLYRIGRCLNSYVTVKQRSTLLTIFISSYSALSVTRT